MSSPDASAAPTQAQILAWLVESVAAALDVDAATVDPTRPFHDYGVSSTQAVSLSGELEEWLDRPLSPALLYEHPTIDALAAALAEPSAPPPVADAPAPVEPVGDATDRRVAVVGVGCRFPGDADSPQQFWANLLAGRHAARTVPGDRWGDVEYYDPDRGAPGRSYTDRACFLTDLAGFDAAFFGISPGEARRMDPQQRLLLEVVWAALEDAGIGPDQLRGSRTGVFVGLMGSQEWGRLQTDREGDSCVDDPFFGYGLAPSVAAGRLSYALDLRGPSLSVDTACSSALLAVHLAARSLRAGECDLAVVAGVSALVHPAALVQACRAHMLAADGRCKTFDADADGFVIGEGCGAVVLQRAGEARDAGRQAHAVLRGSAVTQDGRSNGMTAPSRSAQVEVIRAAHADAGVAADAVGYVEAHGSGTRLGDAIEMAALQDVFGPRDPDRPLVVGAVKTNVGHLLGAAGMAGLIKTVAALRHAAVPPNLHLSQPTPDVDWARAAVHLPGAVTPWPTPGRRIAGVSSFGWSGTNVHVVLEQPDDAAHAAGTDATDPGDAGWQVLPLSARSAAALRESAARLHAHLEAHADVPVRDVARTLQVGRAELDHRHVIVERDRAGVLRALRSLADTPADQLGATAAHTGASAVLLFPGTGDQHRGMAATLYATAPEYRRAFDVCAAAAAPLLGCDLGAVVYGPGVGPRPAMDLARRLGRVSDQRQPDDPLERTDVLHAAVFAVEYALARLWLSWGVQPAALVGYSLGEYVAATVAGVFAAPDAVRLVIRRAQLVAGQPPGVMVAVPGPASALADLLPDGVTVTATNGPAMTVVGGAEPAARALELALDRAGLAHQRVATTHAMHTPQLAAIADQLAELVAAVPRGPLQLPVTSTVTGRAMTDDEAQDPWYWATQVCRPVRFDAAVADAVAGRAAALLELGPGQALTSVAHHVLAGSVDAGRAVAAPTMRPAVAAGGDGGADDLATALDAVGRLWAHGGKVRWDRVAASTGTRPGRLVRLPTYPFEHQRYWPDRAAASSPPAGSRSACQPPAAGDPDGNTPDLADWCYQPIWRQSPPPRVDRLAAAGQRWLVLSGTEGPAAAAGSHLLSLGADVTHADHAPLPGPGAPVPTHVLYEAHEGPADPIRATADLVAVVQSLGRRAGGAHVRIVVLSTGLHDVAGDEPLRPEQATLLGLCRTVGQEYPTLRLRNVDVSPADAAPAELLAAELAADVGDELVAYRHGRRWVRGWERTPIGPAPAGDVWRPDGIYLVTGGLGGLGLSVARQLAAGPAVGGPDRPGSWRPRLALLGRQPLPPRELWDQTERAGGDLGRKVAAVRELERLGAQLLPLAADVADADQVADAVARVRGHFGGLHGVVHAAGVPASGLLALKRPADVARVLRPKVAGALALDTALAGLPLDFVVHFSSAVVALGGLGESDYCAANAFLDAHAHAARRQGRPVTAVDWGPWRWDSWATTAPGEAGASLRELRQLFGITDEQGFDLLTRVLAARRPQVLVAQQDLAGLAARWEQVGRRMLTAPAPARRGFPRPALRSPYAAPRTELERRIAAIWSRHLGIDRIGVDDPFFELGGTSLVGLTIVSEIERDLGITLTAADLFEAPTPATLAELVAVRQRRSGSPADEPAEPVVTSPAGGGRGEQRRERARLAAEAAAARRSSQRRAGKGDAA